MEERLIDKVMNKEIRIKNVQLKVVDFLFVICLFFFSFMIRWELMPIESADYYGFLKEWMQTIRDNGGIASLSTEISNYTSPYMYIMTFLSYVRTNDLYALKLVSVFFDYMASVAVYMILYHMTENVRKSILGMALLLLLPTVILDGAYWCQCDIIYACFLLYSFYYFLKGKSSKSILFFAVAFTFKMQSLFLLPFYIIMWLKKETIKLFHFIWVPIVYIASALPAWMAGRDLKELLFVYIRQSGYYPWGTLEYPNIYALLGETMPDLRHAGEVSGAGTYMTIIVLGCIAYYFYTKKVMLTQEIMVTLALFTVALTVYGLPHMHDRYGFLVDLLAVVYGVYNVKKLPILCAFVTISVLSYMPYLLGTHMVPIQYLAVGMLAIIVCVGYDLYHQIQNNSIQSQEPNLLTDED